MRQNGIMMGSAFVKEEAEEERERESGVRRNSWRRRGDS